MNKKLTSIIISTLVFGLFLSCNTTTTSNNAIDLNWQENHPGIWQVRVGAKQAIDLLSAAGSKPNTEALKHLSGPDFPFEQNAVKAKLVNGQVYLSFPLEKNEKIFGLGLNFKTVQQRGRIMRLHVDHYGGSDNGRTHAPVPFYVSSEGYGVLINSAQYIDVYVGTGTRHESPNHPQAQDRNTDPAWNPQPYSDAVEIRIPADGAEVLVFGGPQALDVISRYNLYCGGGPLPPKWGLGFWHRVPTLYSADQAAEEVRQFTENDFPLDVLGLEPGWQSKSYPCTYSWDKGRFPDPAGFTKNMLDKGIHLNLWINPYISPDATFYDQIKPLSGSHTVWCGLVPDYELPETQRIIRQQFESENVSMGVSGYKIDECDGFDNWLWPDVATFPSGISAEQVRQVYGLQLQKMTTEMYREKNQRTYGLVRASNAGAVSFPYVIYNDYYSHPDFITALVNSSFAGVLWTPEVRNSGSGEEWLRRMQSVCFSPMAMINAWSDGTKPWSFPDVYEEVKEVAKLRLRLLPYLYSEFARYHFEGLPPFRAMQLEPGFLNDPKNSDIKDQFMVGKNLLVAPMFAGQKERTVILPDDNWYDFYSGEFVGQSGKITVKPGLDKIPLFVRDGGMIPLIPAALRTPAADEKVELEVRHYGKKAGSYKMYDDDGQTFDYEQGKYTWRELSVQIGAKYKKTGQEAEIDGSTPWNYSKVHWNFMTE